MSQIIKNMEENKKPNNPPAFAAMSATQYSSNVQKGMALRDYFAAKAMQGICADGHTFWDNSSIQGNPVNIAKLSFEIADEMLKQSEL